MKEDRKNWEVIATTKTSSQQQKDNILREYVHSAEWMWGVGRGAGREGHKHTKEEQVLVKNPNHVILSDELNDEAAQISALKKKEHMKYRIMKILKCSGRKPTPN